jgi:phosphoribosylformimino-5-aminoimidazole carboxamide ribotide isomerase
VPFQVIPAIDIQGGKAVRLRQGRAEDATVFSDSPLEVARRFVAAGASRLHVVDLDGAFLGKPVNAEIICRIASGAGVPVQVGGGVRNYDSASRYFAAGVSRVILGTSIVRSPEEVTRITRAYPGKVAAGIDARDGRVAIRGWVEVTGVIAVELARQIEEGGVSCFIYTDIARDGRLDAGDRLRRRDDPRRPSQAQGDGRRRGGRRDHRPRPVRRLDRPGRGAESRTGIGGCWPSGSSRAWM